jgi:hypothetical protein
MQLPSRVANKCDSTAISSRDLPPVVDTSGNSRNFFGRRTLFIFTQGVSASPLALKQIAPPTKPQPSVPVKPSEPVCFHCHKNNDPARTKKSPFFIKCSVCAHTYHPSCTFTSDSSNAMLPVLLANALTYPWVCNDCKVCLVCKEAGDEAKLIICDACDRTYHTFCLEPKLSNLPTGLKAPFLSLIILSYNT